MRAGVRKSYGGSGAGGGNRVNVEGPMRRRCPKCDAAPGWRCGRYVGAVWEPNKGFHHERRAVHRTVLPALIDATAVDACVVVVVEVERSAAEDLFSSGRCGPTALPLMGCR